MMKYIKKTLVASLIAGSLSISAMALAATDTNITTANTTAAANTGANTQTKKADVSHLFVISSRKGRISEIAGKPGEYKLEMFDTNQYIEYFTDRPTRITGVMPIEQLIALWDKGTESFKNNPPNAGISAIKSALLRSKPMRFSVELTQPEYNLKKHTLTFVIKPLQGSGMLPKDMKFHNMAVFVDNLYFCSSCSGNGW